VTGVCQCGHSESAHVERRDPDIGVTVADPAGCVLCGCERYVWETSANHDEDDAA
jgi:hypothetical protein